MTPEQKNQLIEKLAKDSYYNFHGLSIGQQRLLVCRIVDKFKPLIEAAEYVKEFTNPGLEIGIPWAEANRGLFKALNNLFKEG